MSKPRVRLAVLGDPLRYTRSPDLHRAGLATLGFECESRALPTAMGQLEARLAELAAEGVRGVNLTTPLKEPVLAHLARISPRATQARSVNTVGFEVRGAWGDTTDGEGFVDLLRSLGRMPGDERVVMLGAGGAARSLAHALMEAGAASIAVAVRDRERAARAWDRIVGPRLLPWESAESEPVFAAATLVVNAAPIEASAMPIALERTAADALFIDLRYEHALTPWVAAVRARGRSAYDGLGLLVFQARRSIELWMGQNVPIEPLAEAVGWPR